jgi:malate dehydrogenase (oxaloacetate-decarboxylating)
MSVDQGLGVRVLEDPLTNKGTAFSEEERSALGLRGLLPAVVETLEQQVRRRYQAYQEQPTDVARHINLRALQDTNEVLFYRLVSDHIEEMLPVLYTPTVGLACQRFSEIYRRPRGLFIAYPDRDRIGEILRNRPRREVDVIVVTDGQRILGLGDQGIGGMGIPIGKLSLYAVLGGIDPARTLPVLLDAGTGNAGLLEDPMYLGWRHHRIAGAGYDDFVDRFVQAVRAELPGVLLQWEDFATPHALPILERYRDQLLSFNDDIQGTAAVVLGALSAGAAATGSRLRAQTLVMLGAGSAGIGVCEQVVRSMVADGLSEPGARARIYVVDVNGLLTTDRPDLSPAQRRLAQPPSAVPSTEPGRPADLTDVIDAMHPTALIGLSTASGAFTEQVVRRLAAHAKRPIIMPLSNPTSCSEARPQDLADWTEGRALVATGSPFPPMRVGDASIPVAQCNNIYIFPGIGLAVTAVRATRVTDAMMTAAAAAVGEAATIRHDPHGTLLPDRAQLAEIATVVAGAVARAAVADAVAPALTDDQIDQAIDRTRWLPCYQSDEAARRPLIVRLSGAEPVGDGADDDISAGTEDGGQQQSPRTFGRRQHQHDGLGSVGHRTERIERQRAIRFRPLGDLRKHGAFLVRFIRAPAAARGRVHLATVAVEAFQHGGHGFLPSWATAGVQWLEDRPAV